MIVADDSQRGCATLVVFGNFNDQFGRFGSLSDIAGTSVLEYWLLLFSDFGWASQQIKVFRQSKHLVARM